MRMQNVIGRWRGEPRRGLQASRFGSRGASRRPISVRTRMPVIADDAFIIAAAGARIVNHAWSSERRWTWLRNSTCTNLRFPASTRLPTDPRAWAEFMAKFGGLIDGPGESA